MNGGENYYCCHRLYCFATRQASFAVFVVIIRTDLAFCGVLRRVQRRPAVFRQTDVIVSSLVEMYLSISKCNSRPSRLGRVLLAAASASSYRSKHD